ncbi:hypothetical protein FZI85_00285 [Mycobacterium sp. CBMA293]|uniref:hypothetical protein n=1 Tax=unclassified Mycolicibacterium TaxID=2636767 RepID=UPI0012DF9AA9|nr:MULTISPECIES: hypothetical protein [unclassified Mycolicibacterium]MUL49352.1 hypothetical protein [Mycolicibacterium sp. CBMA 360]MUL57743.1 hypothetical protein [Mycolicibacterium sp. CBMA 335]MUL72808.1 hypothetical protein [Mycolicibacterium sp. CBMA 311]MUL96758.1 hypothetical protein [Mycolicibacterium sp. CBMA 230]MUM09469.1 hypothetical protein [Mycolicibacterium sp. CBMA 293]
MTTINAAPRQHIEPDNGRRRQIPAMQLIFVGAATFATLTLFNAAQSGDTAAVVAAGPVHLADYATNMPAPAAAPFGHVPQTAPSVLGAGGFAADDNTSTSNDTIDNSDSGQDTNPSSGDIFTQNAQDQSTACGAGAAC